MKNGISSLARCLVALTLLLGVATLAEAQDKKANTTSSKKAKKERAKPRGRLPAYFARVVSALQREKIYDIQAKYRKRIEMLKAQLDELYKQRDEEVVGTLTTEQRTKVAEFQDAARKRRADRAKAKTATRGNNENRNK